MSSPDIVLALVDVLAGTEPDLNRWRVLTKRDVITVEDVRSPGLARDASGRREVRLARSDDVWALCECCSFVG